MEVSSRMKVHKTVVTVSIDKASRRFLVSTYGNSQFAMVAASFYERSVDKVLKDFDAVGRKPERRHELLVQCGWPPEKDSKRNIANQRRFILEQMSTGKVDWLEQDLMSQLLGTMLPQVQHGQNPQNSIYRPYNQGQQN